jgi:threonine synthase
VPTGNFGDAFAGWAAARMGLPVARILAATNANDILVRAFATGRYARATPTPTSSPAMDIQSASNFERLVFELGERDGAATRRLFERFEQSGGVDLEPAMVEAIARTFDGARADETQVDAAMRTSAHAGGIVDPHTAVALAALSRSPSLSDGPVVVLSTAHPAKFPEAVLAATGQVVAPPAAAARVATGLERFDRIPADTAAVKAFVRAFALA